MNLYARTVPSSDYASGEYLHVNNCGLMKDILEDIVTYRHDGRKYDYQIFFVEKGRMEQEGFTINSGGVIIFPPGITNQYKIMAESKASYLWLHFSGVGVRDVLEKLNMDLYSPFYINNPQVIVNIFKKIISELQNKNISYEMNCTGLLWSLLSMIARGKIADTATDLEKRLFAVASDMQQLFGSKISIQNYANACGLSQYGFSRHFKQKFGVTPCKYLSEVRIEAAKGLLLNTGMSIAEIAENCGYQDQFYFSKVFKKCEGISPSDYRR